MGKRGEMVPAIDRLMPRVVKEATGCWTWTGATRANGYGYISEGSRSAGTHHTPLVHRVAYAALVGPIPEGLQLDHLCRNRACVNPEHLEPVTPRENVVRGMSPTAAVLRTNHCQRGHELAGDNVYVSPGGKRRCQTCWRACNKEGVQRRNERRVAYTISGGLYDAAMEKARIEGTTITAIIRAAIEDFVTGPSVGGRA